MMRIVTRFSKWRERKKREKLPAFRPWPYPKISLNHVEGLDYKFWADLPNWIWKKRTIRMLKKMIEKRWS